MQKELRFKSHKIYSLISFIPTVITLAILIYGQEGYIPLYRRFKTALSNFPDHYRFDTDHLFFIGFCFFVFITCVYNPIKIISGILTQKAAINGEPVDLTFVDYRIIKIKNGNNGPRSAIKLTFECNNELLTIDNLWLAIYQTEKFFENNNPTDFKITGYMHNDLIYVDPNDIEQIIYQNHRGVNHE